MCEIFPEVEKCCFCIELRLAMLFIAVFSVVSVLKCSVFRLQVKRVRKNGLNFFVCILKNNVFLNMIIHLFLLVCRLVYNFFLNLVLLGRHMSSSNVIIISALFLWIFLVSYNKMMGSLGLSIAEQKTNASFANLKNVTEIDEPDEVLSGLNTLIVSGLTGLSAIFILAGLLLLFGNLTDQEGIVQLFVWLVFLNVVIGYLLIIMVVFECVFLEGCMLASMDWLTAAFFLIAIFFYLTLWIYFVTIANSYVLNASS